MIRTITMALVAPLAMAATLVSPSTADASNRYAVTGIENTTQYTVRMYHKWGSGEWKLDVLKPGEKKWFWHTYAHADENKSPKFHVKFDSDFKPGEVFMIDYDLKKTAAPAHEWENAHKYVFQYDHSKAYVDLYEKK